MNAFDLLVVAVVSLVAWLSSYAIAWIRVAAPPLGVMRTNVNGREVPAVLGDAVAVGAMVGLLVLALAQFLGAGAIANEVVATAAVVTVMWAAGTWDDRRGDERARGFRGHLGALRARAVTGGIVKIAGGVAAGLVASAVVDRNGASPVAHAIETIVLVGLAANLLNLLDRAPGRAAKVAIAAAGPLLLLGPYLWAGGAVAVVAALTAVFPADLREEAMLGDAGSNPVGAVLGLGLAVTLGERGRLAAIALLLGLNLASEVWSFSRVIASVAPLRWLDELGRLDHSRRD